jgi:hypothetical protein
MKALHQQQFAITVDGQTWNAFDAAVKQPIGIGVLGMALIEQGFARDKGGGELFDERSDGVATSGRSTRFHCLDFLAQTAMFGARMFAALQFHRMLPAAQFAVGIGGGQGDFQRQQAEFAGALQQRDIADVGGHFRMFAACARPDIARRIRHRPGRRHRV